MTKTEETCIHRNRQCKSWEECARAIATTAAKRMVELMRASAEVGRLRSALQALGDFDGEGLDMETTIIELHELAKKALDASPHDIVPPLPEHMAELEAGGQVPPAVRPAGAPTAPDPVPPWVFVAWLLDRREQYRPSNGTYAAFDELLRGAADGAHVEAWRHGELDDLRERAQHLLKDRGTRGRRPSAPAETTKRRSRHPKGRGAEPR